ncbi:MAG: hypothetical protein VXW65_12675, partial [Pseudomonadota bacterium]|nr:hypothetical protein [Pseudomonadota bacterium]
VIAQHYATQPHQRCQLSTSPMNHLDLPTLQPDAESVSSQKTRTICPDCLATLAWHGYSPTLSEDIQQHIQQSFDLIDFYQQYPSMLSLPEYQSLRREDGQRPNTYTDDWPEIAHYVRDYSCWICASCQRNYTTQRDQLQVEHVNGLKYDNTIGNLYVICRDCQQQRSDH